MFLQLKRLLEKEINIVEWNPSNEQLLSIAKFIQSNSTDLSGLSAFICETCEDVTLMLLEGQDYSDLNTLLVLARIVVDDSE